MSWRSHAQDRAAVAATAIIEIIVVALRAWFHGDRPDLAAAGAEIEALLREHFDEIARQTRDEIRPE